MSSPGTPRQARATTAPSSGNRMHQDLFQKPVRPKTLDSKIKFSADPSDSGLEEEEPNRAEPETSGTREATSPNQASAAAAAAMNDTAQNEPFDTIVIQEPDVLVIDPDAVSEKAAKDDGKPEQEPGEEEEPRGTSPRRAASPSAREEKARAGRLHHRRAKSAGEISSFDLPDVAPFLTEPSQRTQPNGPSSKKRQQGKMHPQNAPSGPRIPKKLRSSDSQAQTAAEVTKALTELDSTFSSRSLALPPIGRPRSRSIGDVSEVRRVRQYIKHHGDIYTRYRSKRPAPLPLDDATTENNASSREAAALAAFLKRTRPRDTRTWDELPESDQNELKDLYLRQRRAAYDRLMRPVPRLVNGGGASHVTPPSQAFQVPAMPARRRPKKLPRLEKPADKKILKKEKNKKAAMPAESSDEAVGQSARFRLRPLLPRTEMMVLNEQLLDKVPENQLDSLLQNSPKAGTTSIGPAKPGDRMVEAYTDSRIITPNPMDIEDAKTPVEEKEPVTLSNGWVVHGEHEDDEENAWESVQRQHGDDVDPKEHLDQVRFEDEEPNEGKKEEEEEEPNEGKKEEEKEPNEGKKEEEEDDDHAEKEEDDQESETVDDEGVDVDEKDAKKAEMAKEQEEEERDYNKPLTPIMEQEDPTGSGRHSVTSFTPGLANRDADSDYGSASTLPSSAQRDLKPAPLAAVSPEEAAIRTRIRALFEKKIGVGHKMDDATFFGSNLYGDLGMDQLDVTELVMETEKEFNVNLPPYSNIYTPGEFVEQLLAIQ
ncbi:unnamed protein product [Notodromas monacha]|uniref:Carrier domain-containing protein n=1 Tax=Notodromas monacha TaxID=399045 RepID=A0A7R9GCL0_9CRUS|nr:unnamed protein product [Notodromas monacha]CAG0917766.1 unnamed protein product [Notodromas monacha]